MAVDTAVIKFAGQEVNLSHLRFINKSATYNGAEFPVTVGTVYALLSLNGSCSFMTEFNLVYGEGLDFPTTERVLKSDPRSSDLSSAVLQNRFQLHLLLCRPFF